MIILSDTVQEYRFEYGPGILGGTLCDFTAIERTPSAFSPHSVVRHGLGGCEGTTSDGLRILKVSPIALATEKRVPGGDTKRVRGFDRRPLPESGEGRRDGVKERQHWR